jgi:hypothetical protein
MWIRFRFTTSWTLGLAIMGFIDIDAGKLFFLEVSVSSQQSHLQP